MLKKTTMETPHEKNQTTANRKTTRLFLLRSTKRVTSGGNFTKRGLVFELQRINCFDYTRTVVCLSVKPHKTALFFNSS